MVSSNDVQRLFLQAILSRRVVTEDLAVILWQKCVNAVKAADDTVAIQQLKKNDKATWGQIVTDINNALDKLHLELEHTRDEVNGKWYYILTNKKDDAVAQMATDYSATEIAYFKALIEQIMLAPHESYSVSSLAALREVNSLKANMTKAQAEVVLGSFVAKGWLLKSKQGRYSLATRTRVELEKYLQGAYPDEYRECIICNDMITRGKACHTPNCKVRIHDTCLLHHNNATKNRPKCPSCNTDWFPDANLKKLLPIGEAAYREGQDQGRRRVRKTSSEDSDGGEMEGEAELEASQPSQLEPSQTSKKKGKKKAQPEEIMDIDEDDPPPRTQKRKSRR